MKMLIHQLRSYIKFRKNSVNKYGVHSPYVYHLITDILDPSKTFYPFEDLENERDSLLKSDKSILVKDFGAGSRVQNKDQKKIANIAKHSLTKPKNSQRLFRFVNHRQPSIIVELGTCLGLQTAYFSLACPDSEIFSFEGSPGHIEEAKSLFERLEIENVEIISGNMDDTLDSFSSSQPQIDLVFFDGNHQYDATLEYAKSLLASKNEKTVWIFDDIYWSKEMTQAWEEIKQFPGVTMSLDFFDHGFIFFEENREIQHLKIRL